MEQVAIVGARIRVPGAETPDALWANLVAGRSSILPVSEAELAAAGIDPRERRGPGYVARAGWIDGIEDFDHAFFDYSFREAQHLDPQQRLLLTLSHQLLEDVAPPTRSVGVFVSVGFPSYLVRNLLPARADPALSAMGNSSHAAATRIAYKLNLNGPALAVECGCSSSLAALHLARISILTGQCEMALVGGCSLQIPIKQGYTYQRDGVLSADGECRPFDERASGTVFTSGAVVVAVKKLSAALEDGDDVWCVVLGTAANNDGNEKAGFTAPGVTAQREVVRRVYARAQVSPRTVGYLEAHGTGTALGDPIELQALSEAFAAFTPDRGFCSLGSIKANVGHLDVAAGLAGVVKAGLSLRKRQTPPLAGFSAANPKLDLAASPFFIQTEARPWEAPGGTLRRAAVTSLGVGGTNVHVLLEEAPPARPGLSTRWGLLLASAGKPAELEARVSGMIAAARQDPDQVGDLAYTTQRTAPRAAVRGACFVDASAPEGPEARVLHPDGDWSRRGLAFAFPGQGTQYEGMGGELREHVPAFRAAYDRAAALFEQAGAEDPRRLLGAGAATVARTEALQPYLFTVEYALGRVLLDLGLRPAVVLGHSLGELVAAAVAGVFDLEVAVRLVAARARAMAAAPRGAMLALQMPEEAARRYAREGVSICAVNGARSSVLGGTAEAIDAVAAELARAGEKAVRLATSHAFHSPLMEGAAAELERAFAGTPLRAPEIPLISGVDGRLDDPARFTDPGYWARQVRAPVRFLDCLRTAASAAPPPVLLELGPGRSVSTGFLSSFPGSEVPVLPALGPGREREGLFGLLAQLWLNGVPLDLRPLYRERRGRITPPPPLPLSPQRCWVDARPAAAGGGAAPGKQERIQDWLYQQRWSPRAAGGGEPAPADDGGEVAVLSDSHAQGAALASALEAAGARARLIGVEDLLDGPGVEARLAERLGGVEAKRAVALFTAARPTSGGVAGAMMLALAAAKRVRAAGEGAELVLVGAQGVRTTTEPVRWWNGWMEGFATVARQEVPGLSVRAVDVEEGTLAEAGPRALLARTILSGEDRVCALRGGLLWERDLRALPAPRRSAPAALRRVLILGGTGNVGLVHARHFLRSGASAIALVSRGAEEVQARLGAGDLPDRRLWARRRQLLEEAARAGADLLFAGADATSPAELERAAELAVRRFGGLDAIVHSGGAPAETHFRPFFETDRAHLETLHRAKVEVARSLDAIARRLRVPRVIAVSSISGVLGGLGLLGYATSHNLLDAYAAASGDEECRWSSVAWDAWDFYKEDRAEGAPEVGIDALAISEEEGLEVLGAIQGAGWPARVIASSGDLHRRYASWVLRADSEPRQIEMGERPKLSEEYVEPKDGAARTLAQLWGETLGIKSVGARDNFFELGGDSLIAVAMVERINRALGGKVSVMEIFKYPTVEKLAAWLQGSPPVAAAPEEDARARARQGYFEAMRKRREPGS